MKTKVTLALFFTLISVFLHLYLTSHYYPLRFGMGPADAICNVGESFNCDAVAASSYSSFMNIPLSVWGLATNIILLGIILIFWLGLSENTPLWRRGAFYLSALSTIASITMGIISVTQLSTYCIVCIILYFLSFAILFLLWKVQDEKLTPHIGPDLKGVFQESKGVLICFILIPVFAFAGHSAIMKNYGAGEIESVVRGTVLDWESLTPIAFTATPAFSMGAPEDKAKLVISEFADFRCPHCKDAAPSIHAFVKAHPNEVTFKFYTFPLDNKCNSEMHDGDGVSCRLAQAVICANKENKGLQMHDEIFAHQADYRSINTVEKADVELKEYATKLGLNFENLQACMGEASTADLINSHVQQAKLGGLRGTPTVYANSKKLERGQLVPVLEAVLKSASK